MKMMQCNCIMSLGVPVTLIGPDVSVTVGDQVTVACSVSGYPLSTAISWLKIANGIRTNIDVSQARFSGGTVSNPSLTINPAESSDEGDYQCSATNILGTSQSGTAYLDVLGSKCCCDADIQGVIWSSLEKYWKLLVNICFTSAEKDVLRILNNVLLAFDSEILVSCLCNLIYKSIQ